MDGKSQGHLGFLFSGFASLFVVSFLDNSRGPLLPVLLEQLDIPYEAAGRFLTVGCIAAVIATLIMGKILRARGERFVALGIATFALLPGFIAPFVDDVMKLLLLGATMGASVAMLGSMCNILTVRGSPEDKRGRFLSFQQAMYGIGSLLAPWTFSILLEKGYAWWWLLVIATAAIFVLGVAFFLLLPESPGPIEALAEKPKSKISPRGLLMIILFAFYVAGEVLASMWMNSLMVAKQGMSPAEAARYGIFFFANLSLARFLCFLFARPATETWILVGSLIAGISFCVLGQQGHSWALPLIGILGPFFPLSMAKISRQFPEQWQAMTIYVYVGIQSMLALMHQSVGSLADALGIEIAFLLSPLFLLISLLLLRPALHAPLKSAASP